MKKVLFVIIVLMFGFGAIAQSKKDETTSKPYHMFKNPEAGYETILTFNEVIRNLSGAWSGTDFSGWHPKLPTSENQKMWLQLMNQLFGTKYTDTKQLLPYLQPGRVKLVPFPAGGLRIYHFGTENGITVFGHKDRAIRTPGEMAVEIDGKIIASNVCLNPAYDINQLTASQLLIPGANPKKEEFLVLSPSLKGGATNEEDLLIKRANLNAKLTERLGEPSNQLYYTSEKQRKPFFKTTVGKILTWVTPVVIGYFGIKALTPRKADSGSGFTQGGAGGGNSNGGFTQGG